MLHILLALGLLASPEIYGDNMLYPDQEDYVGGSGTAAGLFAMQVCTQTADDTTPGVGVGYGPLGLGCNIMIANGSNVGATAITTFDGVPPSVPGTPGSILYVVGPATAANPTTIADAGNFELEYAWSAAGSGQKTRILVLECIAANQFRQVTRTHGIRYFDDKIFVEAGNITDFANAQLVVGHSDTGDTSNDRIGIVGEATADGSNEARGLQGIGTTSSAEDGTGVLGIAHVAATGDGTTAYGSIFAASDTHAGGPNVGSYCTASGGATNYCLQLGAGDINSLAAINWLGLDNNASMVSWDAAGAADMLLISSLNGEETVAVTAKQTLTSALDVASGDEIALDIAYTTNKAAGDDYGVRIRQTDTASGGTSRILDLGVGSSSQWNVTNTGLMTLYGDNWTDTITWYHDETDAYQKWLDGNMIFQTDEGTNEPTVLEAKPKGSSEVSSLGLYDTDGQRLYMYTAADRAYIESQGGALGLQVAQQQDVKIWESVTAGNRHLYLYGWDGGTSAVQYLRASVDATGDALFETDSGDFIFDSSTGDTRFSDENIKDVGDIALDSITADATSVGITMGGTGATSTESLLWKFGETDNQVDVSTTTGVLTVDWAAMQIAAGSFDASDGNITNVGDIALDSITPDGTDISVAIGAGTLGIGDGTYSWNHSPNVGIEGILEVDGAAHLESTLNVGGTLTAEADLASTSAADWDVLDNTDDTLCFESPGDAGTLCIDSRDGADGVKMAGYLTVDGVLTAGGGLAMGGDLDMQDNAILNPLAGIYGEAPTADTDPDDILIHAEHSFSSGSQTAANLVLSGGLGDGYVFESTDWANSTDDTLTIIVGHCAAGVCATLGTVTLTESIHWDCDVTSDAVCACALYTYLAANLPTGIASVSRTDGTCTDKKVFLQPEDEGTYSVVLAVQDAGGGGVWGTATNGVDGKILLPGSAVGNDVSTVAFAADPDTGFSNTQANTLGFQAGGTLRMHVKFNEIRILSVPLNLAGVRAYDNTGALNLGGTYVATKGGVTDSVVIGKDAGNISWEAEGNTHTLGTATFYSSAQLDLPTAEKLYLDAATIEHTDVAGVLDIDLVPTTDATGVVAADIHITAPALGIEATTHYGMNIQYTGDAQDEGASIVQLIQVGFTPNASGTTVYGMYSADNDLDYFIFNDGTAQSRFDGEVHFANNAASATFGLATTDADVVLAFDALTAQGSITYMEDEDRFDFDNDVDVIADLTASTIASDTTISGTAITGTSFVIGGNTLTTTEWGFLDGQDQDVSSDATGVTFGSLSVTTTFSVPTGTDLPATCTQGEIFMDTDDDSCADAGGGTGTFCGCAATNTWEAFQ